VTRRRARGFTLLEIAVALAILGIGVVACMQIFGGSLKLEDRASRESRAVLHARAVMDALLFQPELKNHTRQFTTAEGYRTTELVRDAGPNEGVDKKDLDTETDQTLHYIEVEVAWQDGTGVKTYTVQSLRMAPSED
jgi:prepilin-type N-terminal cleavage/methylation domain-containing protein